MWSKLDTMETIQVVIGKELLRAADRAARRLKRNRSALIREAVREHLQRLDVREREALDRRGYEKVAESTEDLAVCEKVAAWPDGVRPLNP